MPPRPFSFSGGRPQIDGYGDGGFRLAGQRFEGSILLTPHGLYPWAVRSLAEITTASLQPLVDCVSECDFLIVGRGDAFAMLPKNIAEFLTSVGFAPDLMATGAAARTYNVLVAEGRRVAAALIAID